MSARLSSLLSAPANPRITLWGAMLFAVGGSLGFTGCDADTPSFVDDTPPPAYDAGPLPVSCSRPAEGCPCTPGEAPRECYVTQGMQGGDRLCGAGMRYCRDGSQAGIGVWGACSEIEDFIIPGGSALIQGPDICDACDPLCWENTDTPDNTDIGAPNSSGVVYTPGDFVSPGGVTLPASTTATVILTDLDGDGVADAADDCPSTAGLPAFFGCPDTGGQPGIYAELELNGASVTDNCALLGVAVNLLDVYFLVDTTGSMGGEIANLQSALTSGTINMCTGGIIGAIDCIIPGVQYGVGFFRDYGNPGGIYGPAGYEPYQHVQDLTTDVPTVQMAVNSLTTRSGTTTAESTTQALYSAVTGNALGSYVAARTGCPAGTYGYPCFRTGTQSVIVVLTDSYFHNGPPPLTFGPDAYPYDDLLLDPLGGFTSPRYADVINAINAAGTKIIAVESSGGNAIVNEHVDALTSDTGSTDALGALLVTSIDTDGTGLGAAVVENLLDIIDGTRVNVSARAVDNAGTAAVDERNFIESIVATGEGPTGDCASFTGATYIDCLPGTDVNYAITLRNDVVAPTANPQIFEFDIEFVYDGTTVVETKTVRVVVPPSTAVGCSGPLSITANAAGGCVLDLSQALDEEVAVAGTLYLAGAPLTYGAQWQWLSNTQVELLGGTCTSWLGNMAQAVTGDFSCIRQVGTYWRVHDSLDGDPTSTTGCMNPPEAPTWTQLEFEVTTPADTSITFHFQPADTAAATFSAPSASVTVPSASSPIDVTAALLNAGLRDDQRFLRVTAQLNGSADRRQVPTLHSMVQQWECLPYE